MDMNHQVDSFMFDLDNLIRRYQIEYDLSDQALVGALEFAKLTILTDSSILFSPEDIDEDGLDDGTISPHF
jgi:hypothetical protein